MAKVALVCPAKKSIPKPPLNLAYIASYLEKNNTDVVIIDRIAGQDVEKELIKHNPEFVGLTAMTSWAPDAYEVAKFVRENLKAKVIMGGVHSNIMTEEALEHVDIVVKGEGEKAMLDIVQNKIDSRIVSLPYIKNLDELPMPAYHMLDMDFYLSDKDAIIGLKIDRVATMITSRGCPYRCFYCYNSKHPAPVQYHSPERVFNEIKYLKGKYNIKGITFLDDEFVSNRRRIREICELMIKEGLNTIRWECQANSKFADLDLFILMHKAGCVSMQFGFESGSQRILDFLKKGKNTVKENRTAVQVCNEAGIKVRGLFMMGSPTETLEDIEATERFIDENDIGYVEIYMTLPLPGSELWEWSIEHNIIPDDIDYSKMTFAEGGVIACDTIDWDVIRAKHRELRGKLAMRNFSKKELIMRSIKNPHLVLKYGLSMIKSRFKK